MNSLISKHSHSTVSFWAKRIFILMVASVFTEAYAEQPTDILGNETTHRTQLSAPHEISRVAIQFKKNGRVAIGSENVKAMKFLLSTLKKNSQTRAVISSKASGNYAEASRRCFVVMDNLVAQGISRSRIDVKLVSDEKVNAGNVLVILVDQSGAPAQEIVSEKKVTRVTEVVKTEKLDEPTVLPSPVIKETFTTKQRRALGFEEKRLAIVYFDDNQATIDKRYRTNFDYIVKKLGKEDNPTLRILPYAEASEANAVQLANERALHLKKALVQRGYPAEQILIASPTVRAVKKRVSKLKQRRVELRRN